MHTRISANQARSLIGRDRWADGCAIGILAAAALIALATFRDYGLGWDDLTHSQYGALLLSFYGSGFRDTRAFSFVNLYMYGGGFDMAAALIAKILPFDLFETRRLFGAAVGIVGLFAVWRLGRRVGGPVAGLLALALLATCPLYYGHMFINSKDAPFAVMMAITLLGIVRAIEEYPQPQPSTVLMFGLGLGLAIGSRIMGGFAVLYALAALAFIFAVEFRNQTPYRARVRSWGFIRAMWPSIVIALTAMAIVWPWSVLNPLNLPRTVAYFSHFFEKPWRELFAGELILVPEMPRSYVPTLFALTLPEILLTLSIAGLAGAIALAARGEVPVRRRAIHFAIALAAALPIAVAVITRPAMYNGIRHFDFLTPPIAVLGGLAGGYLLAQARRHGSAVLIAGWAVLIAGLAAPIAHMARLHPYEYVYFNQFAGGVPGVSERYMLDYWGLSFKQASQDLLAYVARERLQAPAGRKWKVAACGPHPPAHVILGDKFELTWEPKGADFAMMLGVFYCAKPDAPVIAEETREGVLFARVYDIRGRTLETLFTQPPVESNN